MKKNIYSKKKNLVFFAFLVLLIAGGVVWWFLRSPGNDADKQAMIKVRNAVSKMAILPNDEDPTLATVTNKDSLTDSFLKANAENGDKVLVYVKAARVYIYRPSVNKIVNIGPLSVDASVAQVADTKILIRTGNNISSVANTIKDQLLQNYKTADINSNIEQAARQDYPSTIVIDLTDGDKYDLVTNIMGLISAQRGVLPVGEAKPDNTDILIITGLDKQ